MKAIRLFGVALFTVLMSVGFSSCSKSDDDSNGGDTSISIEGTWKLISDKEYAWDKVNNKPDFGKNTYTSNSTGGLYSFSKNGKNLIYTFSSGKTKEWFYISENEYYYVNSNGVKTDHIIIKELTKEQLTIHFYIGYYKEGGAELGQVATYIRQ